MILKSEKFVGFMMFYRVVLCMLLNIILAKCQYPDSPEFRECKSTIDAMKPPTTDRLGCMMGCMMFKGGRVNSDATLNLDKLGQWASNVFSGSPEKLKKFNEVAKICKDISKGLQNDPCSAGMKIRECMKNNGAPYPLQPVTRKN